MIRIGDKVKIIDKKSDEYRYIGEVRMISERKALVRYFWEGWFYEIWYTQEQLGFE